MIRTCGLAFAFFALALTGARAEISLMGPPANTWSQFPATQPVNNGGYAITNVSTITLTGGVGVASITDVRNATNGCVQITGSTMSGQLTAPNMIATGRLAVGAAAFLSTEKTYLKGPVTVDNPGAPIRITGTAGAVGTNDLIVGYLSSANRYFLGDYGSVARGITVDTSLGNFGVGINVPEAKLHVDGNFYRGGVNGWSVEPVYTRAGTLTGTNAFRRFMWEPAVSSNGWMIILSTNAPSSTTPLVGTTNVIWLSPATL